MRKIIIQKAAETPRGTGWYWLIEEDGVVVAGGNDWYSSERNATLAVREYEATVKLLREQPWNKR